MKWRASPRTNAVRTIAVSAAAALVGTMAAVIPSTPSNAQVECPEFQVCVISPEYRSEINGTTTIEFVAPGMTHVWGRAWKQPAAGSPNPEGGMAWFEFTSPDADGHGTLTFAADEFPHGPITVVISAWDGPSGQYQHEDDAFLQLYNDGGVTWNEGIPDSVPAPAQNMTQTYADDFTGPLSISRTGEGTTYASIKPDGTEFGDAIFGPHGGHDPFAGVEDEYLRIRAQKVEGVEDPNGWNRTHVSGFISSMGQDGSGFYTGGGPYYLEARLFMPAGKGTWPGFWTLNRDNWQAPPGEWVGTELDVVEGYGHGRYICRAFHYHGDPTPGQQECFFDKRDFTQPEDDFAARFHTYGLLVGEQDTVMYVDDREVWRVPTLDRFLDPSYFMINLALGSGWPVDLSRYGNAADMYVDWVRVFEGEEAPTTGAPVGQTIRIQATASGDYVETNTDKPDNPLEATVSSGPGGSTEFVVEDAGDGNIQLKSVHTDLYVEANTAKDGAPLEATAPAPGTGTTFTWEDIGNERFRLVAAANQRWVSARMETTGIPLQAVVGANPGGWTEFVWSAVAPASGAPVGETIRVTATENGNLVHVDTTDAAAPLRATASTIPGTAAEYVIESAGDGTIRLKSIATGHYVVVNTAKEGAPLEATASEPGPETSFVWEEIDDERFRLVAAANQRWVSARMETTGIPLQAVVGANPGGWTVFSWEPADAPLPSAVAIRPTTLGNVFTTPEPAEFTVEATGAGAVSWQVFDATGAHVATGREDVDDGTVTVAPAVDGTGHYRLAVTAELDDATVASAQTSYAVLDPVDSPDDGPFGVATHFGQAWSADIMPLIEQAGATAIRDEMYWNEVESTKGEYRFQPKHQTYMTAAQDSGLDPFIVYSYANSNYDDGATPHSDEARQAFADYGSAVLGEFGDQVPWVEVYNEFNAHFGDIGDGPADSRPDYYFRLLRDTYQTVKSAHPDVVVVGGVTAGVPMQWLGDLFELGGLDYMDVLSVHYPGEPERAGQVLRDLKDLIRQHNDDQLKPVWITEQGWTTRDGGQGVGEITQARRVLQSHVVALSEGVEKYYWYDFMNDGVNPTCHECHFGLVRHQDDPLGRWTPKPSYASYATMTRQLAGAEFEGRDPLDDDLHSYVFTRNGERIRVLWSTSEAQGVTVQSPRPVTVTDLFGRSQTYHPHNGQVYLTVSQDPIYVTGRYGAVRSVEKFTLTSPGPAIRGEPIELVLTVDNSVPPQAPIDATVDIGTESIPISVTSGEVVSIAVSVPDHGLVGDRELVGQVIVDGQPVGRLATRVEVVENPIAMAAKHVLDGDSDVLRTTVTNVTGVDVAMGDLAWQVGELSGVAELPDPMPGGSSGTVDIPLSELSAPGSYNYELLLTVPGRPDVVQEGIVVAVDSDALHRVPSQTITVDGVLDDLSGITPIDLAADGEVVMNDYDGVADLSGDIYFTWDADNFYLSASIVDDVHTQLVADGNIWQGDSIQFAVAPGILNESLRWYEYGIALTPDGPQTFRYSTAGAGPTGEVTGVDLAVTRDEANQQTIYEMALPWDELVPFEPDDRLLSISLLVNDNDGDGRKGWIEWGSGIGRAKNPALFNPSVLDAAA